MVKIVRAASGRGISLAMYSLEVVAYTISLAYAYRRQLPFSTYGENASLTIQNMVITLLLLYYAPVPHHLVRLLGQWGGRRGAALQHRLQQPILRDARHVDVLLAGFLMLLGSLLLFHPRLLPMPILSLLQATTIPISLLSKVPQMQTLHTSRDPGQLSSIVVFAQLAGTLARVYTTRTETDDSILLWGFALASIFNAVIAAQYLYYCRGDAAAGGSRTGKGSSLLPSLYSLKKAKAHEEEEDGDASAVLPHEKEAYGYGNGGVGGPGAAMIEVAIDRHAASPNRHSSTSLNHHSTAWREAAPRREDHRKSRLD